MRSAVSLIVLPLILLTGCSTLGSKSLHSWNFEETGDGNLPEKWMVESTNPKGSPGTWIVQTDNALSSPTSVLALTETPKGNGSTFNLCWTNSVSFQDGRISVMVKRGDGHIDQGGGIIWRVQDKDNYYITRWNPLEDNFRLYRVVNGKRKQLASAEVAADEGTWHTIQIEQTGTDIQCVFDQNTVLSMQDSTFAGAGGVGVWTKADATTSFGDFEVKIW